MPLCYGRGMGTLKESQRQAVLDHAGSREIGTHEWWTVLSFEDGDFALEPDPVLTPAASDAAELELRLYSF